MQLDELDETVTVTLSGPSGTEVTPVIGPRQTSATTTILDNDDATSISIAAPRQSAVDENAGTITFTVTRTGDAAGHPAVNYALSGTAEAADLGGSLAGGTVTFAQGETTKTITLNLTDDLLDELDETVTVTLSGPSGTVVTPVIDPEAPRPRRPSATTTTPPRSRSRSPRCSRGRRERRHHHLHGHAHRRRRRARSRLTTRSAAPPRPPTSAAAWPAAPSRFAQGETTKTITLNLTDDLLDELDETVTVTLSGPSGTDVTPVIAPEAHAATTTILDNDNATSISIAGPGAVAVNENAGTITFTVTRTGDAQGTQSVNYALAAPPRPPTSAAAGGGTVTLRAGRDHQDHHPQPHRRPARRARRDRHRDALGPTGTEVTPVIVRAHVGHDHHHRQRQRHLDLDRGPDAVAVDESAGTITFTVTRTGDAQGTQSVNYALAGTADGRRPAGQPVPAGTVTFDEGETSRPSRSTSPTTCRTSSNETVTVTLSGADRHRGHPESRHHGRHDHHHRQRQRHLDLDRGRMRSRSTRAAGTITFTVTRTGDAQGTQSVNYALRHRHGRRPRRQPGRRHRQLREGEKPRPSPSASPTICRTSSTRPSR